MKIRYLMAGALTAMIASSVFAFDRPFPTTAKRGKMSPALYPAIVIDGKTNQLSPGARIWNQDNLIEMPNMLIAGTYVVNYTFNNEGDIDRIWILTQQEISLPVARSKNGTSE